jgi:hypothetical protein
MDPGRKRQEICRNRFGVAKIMYWSQMLQFQRKIFSQP